MPAARIIREWMTRTLKEKGMTVDEWAARSGVARSTIFRAMKADYKFVTSSRTLDKLARAAGVTPPVLARIDDGDQAALAGYIEGANAQLKPQYLQVRYRVQAGLWLENDADAPIEPVSHPVVPDPRFAGYPQWLEQVVGDSVNLKIQPGDYAHVVDALELGYAPRHGDWVVAERRRAGMRERTIKQVELTPDGRILLVPRSTNPRWSEPVDLTAGARPGEDIEVQVVGLVIGSYSTF